MAFAPVFVATGQVLVRGVRQDSAATLRDEMPCSASVVRAMTHCVRQPTGNYQVHAEQRIGLKLTAHTAGVQLPYAIVSWNRRADSL